MFENPIYPQAIRKTIVAFGSLFSKLQVIRYKSDGSIGEIVKVPIAYGPKEKFIMRLEQDPTLTGHVYVTLPRLAFEILGYNYDPSRAVNKNNKIQCFKDGTLISVNPPAPYNMEIALYLLTKGSADSMAVIEQIFTLFKPEYTVSINAVPELNITTDIPIVLNGVTVADDWEGAFEKRRLAIHTFNFTAKMWMFGGVDANSSVIKRTETEVDIDANTRADHVATMNDDGDLTLDEWTET